MPSAIAPLETTTNEVLLWAAMVVAIDSKIWPPAASVREPIFTTTRRASATEARGSTLLDMVVGEKLIERCVHPEHQPRRQTGRHFQDRVDHHRGGVALLVDDRGRIQRWGDDRERPDDGAVDGETNSARLLHVDADRTLGSRQLEVAIEQVTEEVSLQGIANGPHDGDRAEARQRPNGEAGAEESQGLRQ